MILVDAVPAVNKPRGPLSWAQGLFQRRNNGVPSEQETGAGGQPKERVVSPISSESQQIQLMEVLFDHGQLRQEFATGAQLLREIISSIRQQPPIIDDLTLIRTLLHEPPYNSPYSLSQLLVEWWQNDAGEQQLKSERLDNLRALLAQTKPLQTQLRVESLALHWQNELKTNIDLSDDVVRRQYKREEQALGADVLEFVFPSRLNEEQQKKLVACKEAVIRVWQSIREKPNLQRFTIFFVPFATAQLVSQAEMKVDPQTIIAFDDAPDEAVYTAIHEAIHCAIGAETGHPWSTDFLEGCAERMLLDFGVDQKMARIYTKQNTALLFSLYRGETISSSTVALDRMAELGYTSNKVEEARNQLNYLWGYYLIDSLFDNHKYQQLQAESLQAGKKKYSLILQINRLYSETYAENANKKPPLRQRDALAIVFKQKLQFSDTDFDGLMYQIMARVEQDAKSV